MKYSSKFNPIFSNTKTPNNNKTSQQDGGRGNDRRNGSKGDKDGSNVVFV